jgi:hypothetical protein
LSFSLAGWLAGQQAPATVGRPAMGTAADEFRG